MEEISRRHPRPEQAEPEPDRHAGEENRDARQHVAVDGAGQEEERKEDGEGRREVVGQRLRQAIGQEGRDPGPPLAAGYLG